MPGSLLAVDVGNSRIKFGMFDSRELLQNSLPTCHNSTAVALDAKLPWQTVRAWVEPHVEVRGVIAGANPRGIQKVLEAWPDDRWPQPLVMERDVGDVLDVKLEAPEKVGVDRLLNAVAVNAVRAANTSAVIVSSGTATTVDYVDPEGAFAGGAILPGFEMSARALHEYTALLPLIQIDELDDAAPAALGLDTHHALCSGLFWGQLGAVRELISQLSALDQRSSQTFVTGGGANLLAPHLKDARCEPHLALQGLAIVLAKRLRDSPDLASRK